MEKDFRPYKPGKKCSNGEGLPAKEAVGNKGGFWRRITGQISCRYQNGIVKENADEETSGLNTCPFIA
jgi:hypothetical protein